jgi:hypothetical protein
LQQSPRCCGDLWEFLPVEHDIISRKVVVMSPKSA